MATNSKILGRYKQESSFDTANITDHATISLALLTLFRHN